MLPRQYRLRGRNHFKQTVKSGTRIKGSTVVFHAFVDQDVNPDECPQLAFAVSKRVGGSVQRHRVTRRLRQAAMHSIDQIPAGAKILVRAYPTAANASTADLDRDFGLLIDRISN